MSKTNMQYNPLQPIVWSIAGSDCTGGAGIQADVKTIHNLGAHACTVITAVTAQNANGVQEINPVTTSVLLSQIRALEESTQAAIIKIGLLANEEQVNTICDELIRFKANWQTPPTIVYDPVAVASNGDQLTQDNILPVIKEKLLPLVDVLTPNNNELQKISGVYVFSWQCMETAAQAMLDLGIGSVVIKGGHIDIAPNHSVDYCTDGINHFWLASDKIDNPHTHGTGCTFASAIAAVLSQGYLLRDSFTLAKAYINQGLQASKTFSGASESGAVWQGGWPTNIDDYPNVLVPHSPLANELDWNSEADDTFESDFASVDTQRLGLYPVVDSIEWCERLLKLGVKTIQYREKALTGDALENAIVKAIALGKQYKARMFINDYWQLAIKHKAYGVHLGQEDLATASLAQIKQADIRLGISTHGHYEMLKVKQYSPSYLAVGAIFPTKTKDMTGQIQGVKTLGQLVALNPTIPMVAIGGINLSRAPAVLSTKVGSIAVVTAITEAEDYKDAVTQLNSLIDA